MYNWVNGTEKFNDLKLPKHCRNQSGFMLSELKSPAPAEFREMYKEGRLFINYIHSVEAYRNKTNVRLPQMNSSSHLHSYSRSTSTTPSSSTYLPMSSPRQSPLPDFKSRQPVSQNHLYPPFYSTVGNRMNTDDRFKKQGENPSEVIAERKNFPRPM